MRWIMWLPVLTTCLQISVQGCRNGRITYSGLKDKDKLVILEAHNTFRNQVAKNASNMMKLKWDEKLADAAQAHANQCRFEHFEPNPKKYVSGYGQNLFENWSSRKVTADFPKAVKSWTDESPLFPVKNRSPFKYVPGAGHYTQVVWAETYKLGCGYTEFRDNRTDKQLFPNSGMLTCNYWPAGNVQASFGSVLVQMYSVGKPCSKCSKCDLTYKNLCAG